MLLFILLVSNSPSHFLILTHIALFVGDKSISETKTVIFPDSTRFYEKQKYTTKIQKDEIKLNNTNKSNRNKKFEKDSEYLKITSYGI